MKISSEKLYLLVGIAYSLFLMSSITALYLVQTRPTVAVFRVELEGFDIKLVFLEGELTVSHITTQTDLGELQKSYNTKYMTFYAGDEVTLEEGLTSICLEHLPTHLTLYYQLPDQAQGVFSYTFWVRETTIQIEQPWSLVEHE